MLDMTLTLRALVAVALLGATIVHLAVAAAGTVAAVALLLAGLGLAEAAAAVLVLRGALARDPGRLAALLVTPVIVLSGALTIADLAGRPDLVEALAQPALLGSAALAFSGALVAGIAARRLRADAPRATPARPSRPARQAALLIAAVIATGVVAAPAVASVRPDVVPGSAVSTLISESPAPAGQVDDKPRFATPGHEGHVGYEP